MGYTVARGLVRDPHPLQYVPPPLHIENEFCMRLPPYITISLERTLHGVPPTPNLDFVGGSPHPTPGGVRPQGANKSGIALSVYCVQGTPFAFLSRDKKYIIKL